MVWFDGKPLDTTRDYFVKHTTQVIPVRVESVHHKVNVATLGHESASELAMNEIGVVRIAAARPLFFDRYAINRGTGSFILIDRETNATAGAGMIRGASVEGSESSADRLARLVRGLVRSGAKLKLPEDDEAAVGVLRDKLQGVIG